MNADFNGLYYVQFVSKSSKLIMKVDKIVYTARTKYQFVELVEFEEFGLSLILDGLVQSTVADEHIYHEALVHPAMVAHPNPRSVLIIGGGEGATLREVLKHPSVEKAVMVDIDGELVEIAKRYLEPMHRGSFNDPRSEVVIMDGKEYIRKTDRVFDVVILDLTDPYSSEIARDLYSEPFYRELKKILSSSGIVVTQAGCSFYFEDAYDLSLNSLKSTFRIVREYGNWVPSFGYLINYIVASDALDPAAMEPERIDRLLRERSVETRYYSGDVHQSLFKTPALRNTYVKGKK